MSTLLIVIILIFIQASAYIVSMHTKFMYSSLYYMHIQYMYVYYILKYLHGTPTYPL